MSLERERAMRKYPEASQPRGNCTQQTDSDWSQGAGHYGPTPRSKSSPPPGAPAPSKAPDTEPGHPSLAFAGSIPASVPPYPEAPLASRRAPRDPRLTGRYRALYDECPDCGGVKAKKAFRCKQCSPLFRGENNYAWKGDDARSETKRSRVANRPMPVGAKCEDCGGKANDRHHKDGDPGNNEPSNIAFLCRRCHMAADGRLATLAAFCPEPKPPTPCSECSRPYKPLRRGLCHACNERKRRREAKERAA